MAKEEGEHSMEKDISTHEEVDLGKNDNIEHPPHYTFGKIEVIDYIKDKLTGAQFEGYCIGNVLKYISRYRHKNGIEDLKKAKVYLDWAIETSENIIMARGDSSHEIEKGN